MWILHLKKLGMVIALSQRFWEPGPIVHNLASCFWALKHCILSGTSSFGPVSQHWRLQYTVVYSVHSVHSLSSHKFIQNVQRWVAGIELFLLYRDTKQRTQDRNITQITHLSRQFSVRDLRYCIALLIV